MATEGAPGVCQQPTDSYLLGVALRSFFLVLATHLLAGEVDTTLPRAPLAHRLSWWCRYFNPLNLSWRYYSMFAYRFVARSWGTHQLALINHEEHPFSPPLPYIVGETVHPLRVRRLEMAGLLSSQGILTFSAAYQGALAIQYAISTEGIPYLPNVTVPLAMVGLFRVMASKWVASKIQVDSYPYPCSPSSPASQDSAAIRLWPSVRMHKLNTDPSFASLCAINSSGDLSATHAPIIEPSSSSIIKSNRQPSALTRSSPSLISSPISTFTTEPSPPLPPCRTQSSQSCVSAPINSPSCQPPSSLVPSYPYTACPPSPVLYSPSSLQSYMSPLLPTLSRPYSQLTSSPRALGSLLLANQCLGASSAQTYSASLSQSGLLLSFLSADRSESTTRTSPSSLLSVLSTFSNPRAASVSCACTRTTTHASVPPLVCQQSSTYNQPLDYKSNKFVVAGWIGVLLGLVTMSFLPYKVAAAYQLPRRLLQFSMQLFYQYIAVSEFVFHAFLLFQGPRALANRVLFFNHWTFKAQTVGFYCLLTFMLVIALIDFVRHGYYRRCA